MDPEYKASQIVQHLQEEKLIRISAHSLPDEIFLERRLHQLMIPGLQPGELPWPFTMKKGEKVTKKSKESCVICCVMGDKALTANENNEALKAFTNALCVAPASSNMMAHCYYYRSLALRKLNAYSESLQDIDRALGLPITKEQRENLQKRKTFIQKLLLKSNSQNSKKNDIAYEEVNLSYGESTEINGVSSALALVYSTRFGRHFVATQDIQVGDVLMIQKPYVMVLTNEDDDNPKVKEWFCENCFKTTKAPIPCDNCAMVFYCSVGCKSEAYDKFHKIECKLANTDGASAPAAIFCSLFLRALLIITKQGENFQEAYDLMEDVKTREDRRTAGFKNGKLDGTNNEAILSLLHHRDKENISMIVMYATQIAVELKKHTDFYKRSNDVRSVVQLMIFLSYICFRNFQCLRRTNWQNVIAISIFPVISLLNHSCANNTLSYNDKQANKIVRACKEIKKGDQIFVSYIDFNAIFLPAAMRKHHLQEEKFFTCECEICVSDYRYKIELRGALNKVPKVLTHKIQMRGNDIETLWKILKLILNKHPRPCIEKKILEWAIIDAYLGSDNKHLYGTLKRINIF